MLAMAFILASSTVFNNYIDQDIDKIMQRTKNRVNIFNQLKSKNIFIFAFILGFIGFLLQIIFVNLLTFFITVFGYFVYVIIYTIWLKRTSVYSTIIGSLSGAVPPLAGYTSFSNSITLDGLLFFAILVAWQMPHFFAIGIYRLNDYKLVNIPILPVKFGIAKTKRHMFLWTVLLIIAMLLLYFFSFLNVYYLFFVCISGIIKILFFVKIFKIKDENYNQKWAKKVFWYSIIDITLMCLFIIASI
jgi:protoheme IX farnesyltransferase